MTIKIDDRTGKKVAELLYNSFRTVGILGKTAMPEDAVPDFVKKGTLEHILFLMLTVSIETIKGMPHHYGRVQGKLLKTLRQNIYLIQSH